MTINKIINYNDLTIEIENGYFNATKVGSYFSKSSSTWTNSEICVDMCYFLKTNIDKVNLPAKEKLDLAKKYNYWGYKINETGKTNYLHYELLKVFSYYCSIKFGIFISNQIFTNQEPVNILNINYKRSEHNINKDIKYLLDIMVTENGIEIEHPFLNTLNNKTKTRRVDFIKINDEEINIYELKKNIITFDMLTDVICERRYLELVKEYYNKPTKLIFIGLKGIEEKAQVLLKHMSDVSYTSVQDLMKFYYVFALDNKWIDNKKELRRIILEEGYDYLFDNTFLQNI